MDLVVELKTGSVQKLTAHFDEEEYYLPPEEVIMSETTSRGQFNIIHHDSGLKIDFMIRKDSPHSIEEFHRRRRLPFTSDFSAWIASPEDVIIKKLSFYREGGSEKHLTDIRGIVAQSELDETYLNRWISDLQLKTYWDKI